MKKLKNDETLDRLSELPGLVILQILALLEMNDVVRTAVLSKRWQHLWTTLPCLDFNHLGKDMDKARNFVNRALIVWKGAKILKFKIHLSDEGIFELLCGDMDLWLRFATERNVEELYVHFPIDVYTLPQFMYSCSSLTKLSVDGCILQVHGVVHWHHLKSLTIQVFSVSEDVINKLLSGTPQLETFDLNIRFKCFADLSIQSSSLKKLSIKKSFRIYDPSEYTMLTIWAPNLEALVISGPPYNKCSMKDVFSLTDVNLEFVDQWDVILRITLRQILPTFQHVEAITLSYDCFKVLQVMKGIYLLSPLPNVKKLRFSCDLIKSHEVVALLQIFPKLEMLDIDRSIDQRPMFLENINSEQDVGELLNSERNIIKSMMQLRIVEIGWHIYEESLFQFIEFVLKHATMLEKIVIQQTGFRKVESEDMMQAAEKLLSLQRSFPTVELVFYCRVCYSRHNGGGGVSEVLVLLEPQHDCGRRCRESTSPKSCNFPVALELPSDKGAPFGKLFSSKDLSR